jgi:dTDP-4-dehydrorhamnose 3,5-epimerase
MIAKKMIFSKLNISECFLITPNIYKDERGFFTETWNKKQFNKIVGKNIKFVQDNLSRSKKNVLRGLHYQITKPQGKLVRVVSGKVLDVIVDLRVSSPTFKNWIGVKLSGTDNNILWIPPGCAHGFRVLTNYADFSYKTTEYWFPELEKCLFWNDPYLNIEWNLTSQPLISNKDKEGHSFDETKFYK